MDKLSKIEDLTMKNVATRKWEKVKIVIKNDIYKSDYIVYLDI